MRRNRKSKYDKQTERNPKARRLYCNRCGAPNWSKQHEIPAREISSQNVVNWDTMQNVDGQHGKKPHSKRSNIQRRRRILCTNRIHSLIQQKINSMEPKAKTLHRCMTKYFRLITDEIHC